MTLAEEFSIGQEEGRREEKELCIALVMKLLGFTRDAAITYIQKEIPGWQPM